MGIKQLYSSDRSEIIWSDAGIVSIKKVCSPEIAHAVDLAVATGLRLGDLLRLSWSHVRDDAIVISTAKSNHKRQAIIPLYDKLRDVLARINPETLTLGPPFPGKFQKRGDRLQKSRTEGRRGPEYAIR
jgi:integrase